MTELEALNLAASGRANYALDRDLTRLGTAGLWKLRRIGDMPCAPYVAHGGFNVYSQPVYESYLTDQGAERLRSLEGAAG